MITADRRYESAKNSVLHIVSLEDKQYKENYPLTKQSPLYAGFGFLEVTPDNKTFYLHESGGDGGGGWTQWYKVDRTTAQLQLLKDVAPLEKNSRNPAYAYFSPDKTKIAYTDFSALIKETDLDFENNNDIGSTGACLKYFNSTAMDRYEPEGGAIMIRDMRDGTTQEVFRNLSYSDNLCKNVARRIIDIQWIDNTDLVFETIDGIYFLDTISREQKTLYLFPETSFPGTQIRPSITSLQLPLIVLSDGSVLHTGTNKQLNFLSSDEQQKIFFVID